MGTNERTTSRVETPEPGRSPRRWGRALLWVALIAVLVVGAIVVSFIPDDENEGLAEPPTDTELFCVTADRFQSFNQIDLDAGGSEQLQGLTGIAEQLGALAPGDVQKDFSAVEDALQNVATAVDAIPPDDPAAIGLVTEKLDDELAQVSRQADDAAAYIERWCGPRADVEPPG